MRKLLLALIMIAGCSKSTTTPEAKSSIDGKWDMAIEATYYGQDGVKIGDFPYHVGINSYVFDNNSVSCTYPVAKGQYSLNKETLSVTWEGDYKGDSFSGDFTQSSKTKFTVVERHDVDSVQAGVYVSYYVLTRSFTK